MDIERKKEIINRLVKEGAIDFNEALELWETEKEIVHIPYYPIYWNYPHINWPYPTWQPYVWTCDTITADFKFPIAGTTVEFTGKEILSFTN